MGRCRSSPRRRRDPRTRGCMGVRPAVSEVRRGHGGNGGCGQRFGQRAGGAGGEAGRIRRRAVQLHLDVIPGIGLQGVGTLALPCAGLPGNTVEQYLKFVRRHAGVAAECKETEPLFGVGIDGIGRRPHPDHSPRCRWATVGVGSTWCHQCGPRGAHEGNKRGQCKAPAPPSDGVCAWRVEVGTMGSGKLQHGCSRWMSGSGRRPGRLPATVGSSTDGVNANGRRRAESVFRVGYGVGKSGWRVCEGFVGLNAVAGLRPQRSHPRGRAVAATSTTASSIAATSG